MLYPQGWRQVFQPSGPHAINYMQTIGGEDKFCISERLWIQTIRNTPGYISKFNIKTVWRHILLRTQSSCSSYIIATCVSWTCRNYITPTRCRDSGRGPIRWHREAMGTYSTSHEMYTRFVLCYILVWSAIKKTPSYWCRGSHYKPKTVVRPSEVYNRNFCYVLVWAGPGRQLRTVLLV